MPASCDSRTAAAGAQALAAIAGPCTVSPTQAEALAPLISALRKTHGDTVAGIIYYGSCLRSGDPYAGLVDFYVIVDSYRAAHTRRLSALFNRLLPPNVYYLERPTDAGTLRCKYAVLSRDQFAAGVTDWFQSGIWGRFAQPVVIVYAQDEAVRREMRSRCGQAVVSLLEQTLPALDPPLAPAEGFARALALSYGSELRVESGARSGELVASDAREYRRRMLAALPCLSFPARLTAAGELALDLSPRRRRQARRAWPLRRAQGRLLSVLRLAKACFTFANAIDYAAWKLERHTGVAITVTPRLRRHPLVFGWAVLWQLYRRRVLR